MYISLKVLGNEFGLDIKYNTITKPTEVVSRDKRIQLGYETVIISLENVK